MLGNEFWKVIKNEGYPIFSGVHDSSFGNAYMQIVNDSDVHFVPAIREDIALGIASSAYFSGQKGGIVMQNSGIGNIINPLTSYNLMYKVPALLIVGWRGFGGPPNDAPEHWIMGEKTPEIFDMLKIPYRILEEDKPKEQITDLLNQIDHQSIPGAILVRPGILS